MSRLRILRCLVVGAAMVTSASAAMAQRAYDNISVTRPYKWTGTYVGFQAGYSASHVDAVSGPYGGPYNQSYSYWSTGFLGGAHLGYNWQYGHYLLGAEADIDASNFSSKTTGSLGYARESRIDWQSTLRARAGWISGPWMLFATGGLAFSQGTTSSSLPGALSPFATNGERHWGWTVGAGFERAITSDTTLRLEYRYLDLGKATFSNASVNSQSQNDLTTHQLRAGISFRF